MRRLADAVGSRAVLRAGDRAARARAQARVRRRAVLRRPARGRAAVLVESFAVEPELHDPLRGRVKGKRAFEAFAAELSERLRQRGVSIEEVNHVVGEGHGFEEVVLHFDQPGGPVSFRSRSLQTSEPTGESKSCGSTSATGRSAVATPTARRCCNPIRSCASPTSSASTSVRWLPAISRRSSSYSKPTATRASRRAARTSTEAATVCARSTSSSSPTAVASRSSTAR